MTALLSRGLAWLLDDYRASHGLAIMRIVFGGMTVLILALYAPYLSYTFGEGAAWSGPLSTTSSVNDYPWPLPFPFDRADSDPVLYAKTALLAAVAVAYTLGWRMRIVSPLFVYLWLGFSTLNPVVTNSGHYQTFRIMLIFLLFADLSRRWSLDARRRARRGEDAPVSPALRIRGLELWPLPRWAPHLFNNTAVMLIAFQVFAIYISSALWKLQGSTWVVGVAVYYPLRLDELTLVPWLNELVWQMTPVVYLASWASVYLQLLFPLLLLNRWTRIIALIGITGMHAGIGVLLALPFFSLVMIASDMIFIRESSWVKVQEWLGARWRRLTRRAAPDAEDAPPNGGDAPPDAADATTRAPGAPPRERVPAEA